MLIKYQALTSHLQKNTKAVYALAGPDLYLLNDAALTIKKRLRQRGECDERILDINTTTDWKLLLEEANSYSLFAEHVLLDVRFDKKTIDAKGKEILNQYLENINQRCLVILKIPAVPAKQLQWLANNENAVVVQITSFTDVELQRWINNRLQQHGLRYAPAIPSLIHQYSQNNMLAAAQAIEKLALIYDGATELSADDVSAHLIDQSDFQLYELADACLAANVTKALHLLRYASGSRAEPTLVLWILTQEIRQLIQLSYLLKQLPSFSEACNQLKIWPKRAKLYEMTLARLSLTALYQLLQESQKIDEWIKTSQSNQIWHAFEKLAISMCLGTS